jgi:signal transduction histidine kinase
MRLLSSLRNRIFLANALLGVLVIAFAIYLVNARVTREAEAELQRSVVEAGTLVEQHRATLFNTFTVMARLIADLPKLKAAVGTNDPPTVAPVALEYQRQLGSALFIVTSAQGRVLSAAGLSTADAEALSHRAGVAEGLAGHEGSALLAARGGVMQVVTVPISVGLARPELLGALDDALAEQFKQTTGSDIAFAADGRILASTLPAAWNPWLATLLGSSGVSRVQLGPNEYVALRRPLAPAASGSAPAQAPTALVLRSRTAQLQFLDAIHAGLAVAALFAVLLATLLSYAVARTITRPLAAITGTMREVAATGDLTRKIALPHRGEWDDEDARLLAATFNSLTDSVARFQREAGERERLSALGRLSTIVAHEIRNPLMIIKASLRTLGRAEASPSDFREAAADIDGEVGRLNRIVNDVLDFARPIRFDCAPTDLNRLCEDAAAAASADNGGGAIVLRLDPAVGTIVTDGERLRLALLNILANARQAVAAVPAPAGGATGAEPPIVLSTARGDHGGAIVVVRDRGVGIAEADLPRVFEPYFTTRRTGTGLGLAISRNIVEGLGGTLAVTSAPGRGTEMRLTLPDAPPAAGSGPGSTHEAP